MQPQSEYDFSDTLLGVLPPELGAVVDSKSLEWCTRDAPTTEELQKILTSKRCFFLTLFGDIICSSYQYARFMASYDSYGSRAVITLQRSMEIMRDERYRCQTSDRESMTCLGTTIELISKTFEFSTSSFRDYPLLDIGTIFFLIRNRLEQMKLENFVEIAKRKTLQIFQLIINKLATKPLAFEMYLSSCAIQLDIKKFTKTKLMSGREGIHHFETLGEKRVIEDYLRDIQQSLSKLS